MACPCLVYVNGHVMCIFRGVRKEGDCFWTVSVSESLLTLVCGDRFHFNTAWKRISVDVASVTHSYAKQVWKWSCCCMQLFIRRLICKWKKRAHSLCRGRVFVWYLSIYWFSLMMQCVCVWLLISWYLWLSWHHSTLDHSLQQFEHIK